MRLLHTTELRFQEFFDGEIPRYAILSHRWGPDEVSYQDFLAGLKKDGAGHAKLVNSCNVAARGGYRIGLDLFSAPLTWIWIDTCCIDKSSSAELSEAINSMYYWYRESNICYVFLKDVNSWDDAEETKSEFRQSEWFTRGWTLQELLAPKQEVFLDRNWKELGHKHMLANTISSITGIEERHLIRTYLNLADIPVAEKMRWAATRRTSRLEDQAYCLLGLFRINMPLLYGERDNAFRRLQMEILRSSDDESVFVWSNYSAPEVGVLASSPKDFQWYAERKVNALRTIRGIQRPPYSVTNKGLEFHVPANLANEAEILLPLNCCAYEEGTMKAVYAIALERDTVSGDWYRISKDPDDVVSMPGLEDLYIVSQDQLWTRDSLKNSGSETIYLKL